MRLPWPQLCLCCSASHHRCCDKADRRGDEKTGAKYYFPVFFTDKTIYSSITLKWRGKDPQNSSIGMKQKILLIFKWNWEFMTESDSLWINILLEVLKRHSLTLQTTRTLEEVALNHLFSCRLRLNFLENTLLRKCYLLLSTLQCRAFSASQKMKTWDYVCSQKRLATSFLDFLFLIYTTYFKALLGGIKMLENVSNCWVLRFCSEPFGTSAASSVICSTVCECL